MVRERSNNNANNNNNNNNNTLFILSNNVKLKQGSFILEGIITKSTL